MAVSLSKGGRANLVDLTKDTGLKKVLVGLGWDTNRYQGSADFDLDPIIFLCDNNKKCISDKHIVFYNNLEDEAGSVKHSGDNRTGAGDGDDETATIDFSKIPENVENIIMIVSIFDAKANNQNFGLVDNAYIRLVNLENDTELLRYDLAEDFSIQESVVFGEIYKNSGAWKFRAVGEGYTKDLAQLCVEYGLEVKNS